LTRDVIQELDFIASKIVEAGGELPASATLGLSAWKGLLVDLQSRSSGGPSTGGYVSIGVHLSTGHIEIKPSPKVPSDFVGIGRMTKNDIIIEDILLDDETYSDLDSDI
jgi:hypothetical protein